ncbi:MAG TPA: P-type conjugative transfer protein TrbG [Sphingomicrobium sp.]|nr:P-type conjugative transfer protein TrbG [Sphingomicrobium sp.]
MIVTAISTFPSLVALAASSAAITASPPMVSGRAAPMAATAHARASFGATRTGGGGARSAGPVEATRGSAIVEPGPDAYSGVVQRYPWSEGAAYRLHAAPERVSDITLQQGETLISVAAGDTARWVIGETSSGAGTTRRTHILVKPTAIGLSTNLMIATDRRVYHVELQSFAGSGMASIAWTYPDDGLLALKGTAQPQPVGPVVTPDLAVEALDFNYRIEGDRPPWRPVRAFDDGHQVFIEFPPSLAQGEAPPLFVRGPDGRPELVNYRQRGRYYVVDRLFPAAELRLGGKRQSIVRIIRGVARPGRAS